MEPISPSISSSILSSSYTSSHNSLSSSFSSTSSANSGLGNSGTGSVIYECKLVLLGCSSVGKTALSINYCLGYFQKRLTPTIGASFQSKLLNISGKKIKYLIWDSAGQERFRSLTPMYYRGACVAIIVYDITVAHTFDNVKSWVEELKQNAQDDIILVICGNKLDLEDKRAIKKEYAKAYADEIKAMYCETSAKDGTGIEIMFLEIAKKILQNREQLQQQLLQQQLLQQQKCNLVNGNKKPNFLKTSSNSSFFNSNNNSNNNSNFNRNNINGEDDNLENVRSSQCCS